jgi:signal transduction histidine kinase
VLLSLARNSLAALERRAMGSAGSRLSIRARRCDGEALLEILDNGPGPGPGEVERLFEPGASSRGSTGLGLYLSRQLAERNGGTLEYVPVELGSCFRISLPLAEDP